MNGRDLIESLGHVDEQYIAEAEEAPKRRRWQSLAVAAACLVLVLVGAWQFRPQLEEDAAPAVGASQFKLETTGGTARSMEEEALDQAVGVAPMMVSALSEMTVQVVEQAEERLLCIVTDPGTSDFQTGDQVTITLPGITEATLETAVSETLETAVSETPESNSIQPDTQDSVQPLYLVTFLPDQDAATIFPVQLTPIPQE